MDIKLLAVDMDDSLLHHDLTITPRNQKAIRRAVEKGVEVVIATGRMFQSVRPYIEQLQLDTPVITCQGAAIIDPSTHKLIHHCPVPFDLAGEVIDFAEKEGVYVQIYIGDEYYFAENCESSELYHRLSGVKGREVGALSQFMKDEPIKILFIDQPERIKEICDVLKERFSDKLEIAISKPFYLELTHPDATKGNAVRFLAEEMGIQSENVMSIGDSYNDISMLSYAGMGVAMGNAPDDVKKNANDVTAGNNEDGVAQAIEKIILGD